MTDGIVSTKPMDLYAMLKHVMKEERWKQPIETYFSHVYDPLNPRQIGDTIQEFAHEHGFAVHDMTPQVAKVHTMEDVVKLYSTCAKVGVAKPNTLFFMVPNLEVPNSLNVVQGLFAFRTSLVSGSFNVFFQDKRSATAKEKKCMRGKRFNLVLFQNDNIITLSNNTIPEIRRQLDNLVTECPICFELLSDINYGAVNYPFECGHAFHDKCVAKCKECPTCRTTAKMKGVVTFELVRVQ